MSTATVTKRKLKVEKLSTFANVLYNNDVTGFDFVVYVLMTAFNLSQSKAVQYTAKIHEKGNCSVFVGSKEACEFKYQLVESIKKSKQEKNLKHEVVPYTSGE